MDNQFKLYFQNRIRLIREEVSMTLEQLADKCFYDKSHLSRVEKLERIISDENLATVYKSLNIDLIVDDIILEELNKKLDDYYYSLVFCDDKQNELISVEMLELEYKYINSPLLLKFYLMKYVYLISSYQNERVISEIEDFIANIEKEGLVLSKQEKQIYMDYKGLIYRRLGDYSNAIEIHEKAVNQGNYPLSYGMACYHLGAEYELTRSFGTAMLYYDLAGNSFVSEHNYARQWCLQNERAVILMQENQHTKAEKIFDKLLKNPILEEDNIKIKINIVWCKMKQKKYQDALNILLSTKDIMNSNNSYYYIIGCYYYLGDYENSLKWINASQNKSIKLSHLNKIKVFKILIEGGENKPECYKKIKTIYRQVKNKLSYENKEFFLELLSYMASELFLYKEAYYYQVKLLNK